MMHATAQNTYIGYNASAIMEMIEIGVSSTMSRVSLSMMVTGENRACMMDQMIRNGYTVVRTKRSPR